MIFNIGCGTPPRPLFNITIDGVTYTFDGQNPISVENKFSMEVKNVHDWRLKVFPSVSLSFVTTYFNPNRTVDFGLVGRGGNGGTDGHNTPLHHYKGGGGGGGGEIKTVLSKQFVTGETYVLNTSGSTSITGGSLSITCNNGGNGETYDPGSTGGNSGNGGHGEHSYNDGTGVSIRSRAEAGTVGGYVFDSTFDSTIYGSGGTGANIFASTEPTPAEGYGNPGSGGNGGIPATSGFDGIIWIKSSTW